MIWCHVIIMCKLCSCITWFVAFGIFFFVSRDLIILWLFDFGDESDRNGMWGVWLLNTCVWTLVYTRPRNLILTLQNFNDAIYLGYIWTHLVRNNSIFKLLLIRWIRFICLSTLWAYHVYYISSLLNFLVASFNYIGTFFSGVH